MHYRYPYDIFQGEIAHWTKGNLFRYVHKVQVFNKEKSVPILCQFCAKIGTKSDKKRTIGTNAIFWKNIVA